MVFGFCHVPKHVVEAVGEIVLHHVRQHSDYVKGLVLLVVLSNPILCRVQGAVRILDDGCQAELVRNGILLPELLSKSVDTQSHIFRVEDSLHYEVLLVGNRLDDDRSRVVEFPHVDAYSQQRRVR